MMERDVPFKLRVQVLAFAVLTLLVWLVLGMVYFDRFLPPYGRLAPLLMSWQGVWTR